MNNKSNIIISLTTQEGDNDPLSISFDIGSRDEILKKSKKDLEDYIWDYGALVGVSARLGLFDLLNLNKKFGLLELNEDYKGNIKNQTGGGIK